MHDNTSHQPCPKDFVCPITLEIMSNPYMCCYCKSNFDYTTFHKILRTNCASCPVCRKRLNRENIKPNHRLQDMIYEWFEVTSDFNCSSIDSDRDESSSYSSYETNDGPLKMKSKESNMDQHDMRTAFDLFDRNGNGFISLGDLKSVLLSTCANLSDFEIEEIMKLVDTNGDGQISYDEFSNLLMSC